MIWSSNAKRDLKQIHDYIARDSKHYAKIVTGRIADSAKKLAEFPSKGRVVPEREEVGLRELVLYSYRLIYYVSDLNIEIVAVLHGRQDLDSNLTSGPY